MSQMDIDIPSWLDEAFLTSALQGGVDQEPRVTVLTFSVTRAVPTGANYISLIYRVSVEYKIRSDKESISLIVKAPITSGIITEVTKYSNYTGMECVIYNKVLPLLNGLLKYDLSPKLFYSSVNDVLVLEDLNDKGYEVCDRYKQFDFEHCRSVLRILAKFHAASIGCKREHPDLITEAGKEALYTNHSLFHEKIKPWIEDSLIETVETVSKMKLGKGVEDLFRSRIETATETMVKHCKPKVKRINVLNHGDLWVNNILFKYSSVGDIEDVKLIDYQLRRYAPPMTDLMYFIWTSANEDVRESKLVELFEIYRLTLNTTLEQLGCEERLSEEEFRQELRDATDLAILVVGHILPITASDTQLATNNNQQNGDLLDAFGGKDNLFSGIYFRALLPKLTEHLQKWNKQFS